MTEPFLNETRRLPGIRCEALSKTFRTGRGDAAPLKGLSLEIPAGAITAVIGESGCGKTTLLRLIAGLEQPDSGRIRFTGPDGRDAPRPPRISVVFQEHRLFPWMTAEENITLAVRHLPEAERRAKVSEALALVGLENRRKSYPGELSGGMAQRVNLARALAASPDILLMDEPFGALDALTRHRLYDEFIAIRQHCPATTLLITHDVTEAVLLASRICELGGGVLKKTLDVPFPYPRTLSTPGVGALSDRILSTFLEQRRIRASLSSKE